MSTELEAPTAPTAQPKRQSLFELSAKYAAIAAAIADLTDDGGEVSDEIITQIDAIEGEFGAKLESCYRMMRVFETEAAAADEELDRVKRIVDSRWRRAAWMKRYILDSMLAAGVNKHNGAACALRVQKNSQPSVSLVPGNPIPEGLSRTTTTVCLDTAAVIAKWKAGEPIPESVRVIEGCHLRTTLPK